MGGTEARIHSTNAASAKPKNGDVRNEQERLTGEIPESLPIPLGDLMSALETLPKARPIVTICESGYRASAAASLLQRNGFEQVSMVRGGMTAWRESVKPMTA